MERLASVLTAIGRSYEIVLIDDGSRDHSWAVIRMLQAKDPDHLVAVRLMRNFGQHNALMCGFRLSRGQLVATMDDDLQNPPEELPKLIRMIDDGDFDLVYGTPERREQSRWRTLLSGWFWRFHRLIIGHPVTPGAFRVMRRQLADSVARFEGRHTYLDGLLAWGTDRIGTVAVQHHRRAQGRSGYSIRKLFRLAFNLFFQFSLVPIRVFSGFGLLAVLLGLILAVGGLLLGGADLISQWLQLSLGVTIGGLQLLAIGTLGEYLGRSNIGGSRRPQYLIRQSIGPASVARSDALN